MSTRPICIASVLFFTAGSALASDPYADHVVSYTSGAISSPTYNNPLMAVGSPERYIEAGDYSGAVTPFNAPYQDGQVVSIGAGGSLILSFDEPITNDASNPYGLDLLIFGNSFFNGGPDFPPTAGPLVGNSSLGLIEVSQNGTTWLPITGVQPDGLFPTVGYSDSTDPYSSPRGAFPTDFTLPVNPAFNPSGLDLAGLIAGYNGSGGGAGIDLSSVGLASITYVRISYLGASGDLQIDAISDVSPVPAPATFGVIAIGGLALGRRRR